MGNSDRHSIWERMEVQDSRAAVIECIDASRAMAELKGMVCSMTLPSVAQKYICLKEAQMIGRLMGIDVDTESLFLCSVAKEKETTKDMDTVLRISDALLEKSTLQPTVENLNLIISGIMGEKAFSHMPAMSQETIDQMGQLENYIRMNTGTDDLIKSVIIFLQLWRFRPYNEFNTAACCIFLHMVLNNYSLDKGCGILVSAPLFEHRAEYLRKAEYAIASGKTEDWIVFMLNMLEKAAHLTMHEIFSVDIVYKEVCDRCNELPFFSANLMGAIFSNLYCKSAAIIESGIAERVTAMKYLKTLEEHGILKSEKIGREVVFRNVLLTDVLCKNE